jgi:hypothetical protein
VLFEDIYVLYHTAKIEEECKTLRYLMKTQLLDIRILLQKGIHPVVCLLRRE